MEAESCRIVQRGGETTITTIIVLELVLARGGHKPSLLLTCPCAGLGVVHETCFLPPFLRGRCIVRALRWCSVVTVDYNSYAEQLWGNSKLFCSWKSSFETETAFLSACSPSLYFPAPLLLAGRQALPLPREIEFPGDYQAVWKCKKLPISQNSACSSRILPKSQGVSVRADLS